MIRAGLLLLSLSAVHTLGLRHVATSPSLPPASANSSKITSPRILETREFLSTPIVSGERFVTNRRIADLKVTNLEGANNVEKILNGIFWILKKSANAVSVYSKANGVKLALEETKDAVEQATGTVERMGNTLLRLLDYFTKTGSGALGKLEYLYEDFSGELLSLIEQLDTLFWELDELLGVSRTVVEIMKSVRGIAADTNEIVDGLLNLDLDSFLIPLEKHVGEAVLRVKEFLSDMKTQYDEAKESLNRLVHCELAKAKEYAKIKAGEIFGDLTPLIGGLNEIYTSMVKPLILELVKAIKAIYKAARELSLPLDAPESVADEIIDRSTCSWRQTRWFKSIEDYNVDIERTMVCDTAKTFGRWFKCWCVGTNDCYVPSKYRPGVKDSRRCFKTV